jgi:hypothetical protein
LKKRLPQLGGVFFVFTFCFQYFSDCFLLALSQIGKASGNLTERLEAEYGD